MDIKQIAKDTADVLASYLTYQAVKTVIAQLTETNPPLAYWLNSFSTKNKIQDGEAYLEELLAEHPDLAFRLMTVREHLAIEVTDLLPEMVRTNIIETNMGRRRQHLERMTQFNLPESTNHPEQEKSSQSNFDNLSG